MLTGAHPRSRGENVPPSMAIRLGWGSSPLTRGKRVTRASRSRRWGLIPAHAGKTSQRLPLIDGMRAHPRSRGENHAIESTGHAGQGSSPLTRGKQATKWRPDLRVGLIPAHAGKTPERRPRTVSSTAHPRSRGENVSSPFWGTLGSGSSPLTRGKPCSTCPPASSVGLIPAHAGKTTTRPAALSALWAHPRSRGENAYS